MTGKENMDCFWNNKSFFNQGNETDRLNSSDHRYYIDETILTHQDWYQNAEYIIDRYVTHTICLFGIIGNFINIIVLTRKTAFLHMGRLERSVHLGLIALAVSDLSYCLCSFPQSWKDRTAFGSPSIDFWLLYDTYGNAIINCFLLSSSWLTVAMTTSRYLVICHPVKGHQYLSITVSGVTIILVFLLSILFNLPRFWMRQITSIQCDNGETSYFHMADFMETNHVARMTYMWSYFILGIVLPLLVLGYCNIYLAGALCVSSKTKQHKTVTHEANRIMTLTLCLIVVLFLVLVGPAELVTFWKPFVSSNTLQYGLALRICNCLQMLNFAINFILYFIINVQFRKVIRDLLYCIHLREHVQPTPSQSIEEHATRETSPML